MLVSCELDDPDIEAHKGYRRADRQEQQDRKGGLVVRIVKFAGDKHGGR